MTPDPTPEEHRAGTQPTPDSEQTLGGVHIATFAPGPYATNCYVLSRPPEPACVIVDAGFEPDGMLDWLEGSGLRPAAVVLTHTHVDHIMGLGQVRDRFPDAPIYVHDEERAWLADPARNLSLAFGMPFVAPDADHSLEAGTTIEPGGIAMRVLATPGHSPGGVTLVIEGAGAAIVGDALFAGSIGRTDFPGSDFATLAASIRSQLYALPDETLVLPGHGPSTTIGREKKTNPFVPEERTGSGLS